MKQDTDLYFACCRGFPSIDATRRWASKLLTRHGPLLGAWSPLDDEATIRALSRCPGWWPLVEAALDVLSRGRPAEVLKIEPRTGTLRITLYRPTQLQRGVAELAQAFSRQKCPGCGRDLNATMDLDDDPLIQAVIDAEREEARYDGTSLDIRVAVARLRSRAAVAYWDSNSHTEQAQWLRRAVDELETMPIAQLVWQPDSKFAHPARGQRCWQVSPFESDGPTGWWERLLWSLAHHDERCSGTWVAKASLCTPNREVGTGILMVSPQVGQAELDRMLKEAVAFPKVVSRSIVRKPEIWAAAACIHNGRLWTPFSEADVLGPWMAWPLQL